VGRFTQADTIIPDPGNPLSLDRYAYAYNNPVKYIDPTGHYVCEDLECGFPSKNKGQYPGNPWATELKRQDELFSRVFPGSGDNGKWTEEDWGYYYDNRAALLFNPESWLNPEEVSGWSMFALHAARLASGYGSHEYDEFVRDFALLFAGIPYYDNWMNAAWASRKGPAVRMPEKDNWRSFVYYGNEGLVSFYYDDLDKKANQSHHYAGSFFLGYFLGHGLSIPISIRRDIKNPGDLLLGDVAAFHGDMFKYSDISGISIMISGLEE